jgi:hypothetical protein
VLKGGDVPKGEGVTKDWRKLRNDELRSLYQSLG